MTRSADDKTHAGKATDRQTTMTPPLSPVLLAGILARPVPLAVLQPALNAAMAALHSRHPDVFERLAVIDDPVFQIDPVDLPFVFVLHPDPLMPTLTAYDQVIEGEATATIRGPLMALIELLEGRTDGDALFFSRDLIIEGDTEAVVALRNAVDGAEVNVLEDVLSMLGPLAGPAQTVITHAGRLFERATKDLEILRDAMIAPAMKRQEAQAAKMRKLDDKIDAVAKRKRPASKKVLPKKVAPNSAAGNSNEQVTGT